MKELSAKQLLAVAEYLVDLNKSAAYQRAGYRAKGRSADSAAARLFADVRMVAAVEEGLRKRNERVERSADDVLRDIEAVKADAMRQVLDKDGKPGAMFDRAAALKALELEGRHRKMFTDKVEHSGAVSVTITRFGNQAAAKEST